MRRAVPTVDPEAPLIEVAAKMVRRNDPLPVVANGQLIGIISRSDIVAALLEKDRRQARSS